MLKRKHETYRKVRIYRNIQLMSSYEQKLNDEMNRKCVCACFLNGKSRKLNKENLNRKHDNYNENWFEIRRGIDIPKPVLMNFVGS